VCDRAQTGIVVAYQSKDISLSSMTPSSILHSIRRTVRNHGHLLAAYDIAVRSLNKCVYFKTLQCIVIDEVNRRHLILPEHLRFTRLEPRDLLTITENPEYEMSAVFVQHALAKGDECYAILDEDILASYGWYARSATSLDPDDLIFHFDAKYVYMYKGFTLHSYRGQRLHAIGMNRALAEYQSRGFKGLVSCVESNNFDSLKSCYRMGYHDCGRIRVTRIVGKYLFRTQPACRPYGISLRVNDCRNSLTVQRAYHSK
jgi:hypothetical protein